MTQYQLVLRVGPSPGKVYPLVKNEIAMGRDINNEIVINDAEISRKHCRLKLYNEGYVIEDLGSTNGTWVNEQRISSPHQLHNGETIRLGDNISLVYEVIGFDPDATVASSSSAAPPTAEAPPTAIQQQYEPPPQQYQPPPPDKQYGGRVPAPADPPKILGMNRGLAIGLGVLAVISICVVAFLFYVDANCLWCEITWDLLPGCPYTSTPACP